ncbi:MAG: acylneuraminate cytidylyltransferase family protein [Candidatus Omnitrophota bacterium]|nr:acylneuraminate cytidylyltransferase family protein [Candidatus Omnitrophota bacterium]
MNIVCVIPARGGSKRVLDKNLMSLLDKPLIAYTIEAALTSELCDRVIVSTDDSNISAAGEKYGAEIIIRPPDLALDHSPIEDALRHVVRHLEKEENYITDIVVLLQANVPVRKDGEIDSVIRELINHEDGTAVATAYLIDQRPEWMKVIDSETGMIKPFMVATNLYRKQDLPKLYLFDGAVAAVKKEILMETEGKKSVHAFFGEKVRVVIHDEKYAIEIDEKKDYELAEYYLRQSQEREVGFI